MSSIRVNSIKIRNYRSFGNEEQEFLFPNEDYKKPVAIIGYNNTGKTNLLNCILYALQVNFVSKDTFSIDDFHNRKVENVPEILLNVDSSEETKFDGDKKANLSGFHKLIIYTDGSEVIGSKIQSLNSLNKVFSYGREKDDENYQAFGAIRYFNVFYINFHNIKEEISTQKTNWGNLKSFLAKHIKKIVESDSGMRNKKEVFEETTTSATEKVLEDSELSKFIDKIKENYTINLRENNCDISFGLPGYEDIFLQMIFKIGLHGNKENLVPITHFGDGYISMFVMAVIKAIAEFNTEDQCLFLFEEPESFLHENHQEYFYKMVLCGLTEKGHQVIYTTHSDRMVDIFDTKGLIRLEFDEENKQTVKRYNDVGEFTTDQIEVANEGGIISLENYNAFIRSVEPGLNKILFSKKVILVEGPNDLMVYKEAIKRKVQEIIKDNSEIQQKERYAETYLNFHNIAIIPHHGKITAILLMQLCEHIQLDYYVINDWDLDEDFVEELAQFESEEEMKESSIYLSSSEKAKITTNWKLLRGAKVGQIHFNIPKLENVIGYNSDDKKSINIWKRLQEMNIEDFNYTLFPQSLEEFLEFEKIKSESSVAEEVTDSNLPF